MIFTSSELPVDAGRRARARYRHHSRRFHGETVAANNSEAVRDQPSRFAMWRLIVFSVCVMFVSSCVGDCALDSISRPIEGNKEDKGSLPPEPNGAFAVFVSFCLRTHRWIRDIRCLPAVAVRRRRVIRALQNFQNFPRKGSKNFTQYSYERPEITPHDEESEKAKTRKTKSSKGTKNET